MKCQQARADFIRLHKDELVFVNQQMLLCYNIIVLYFNTGNYVFVRRQNDSGCTGIYTGIRVAILLLYFDFCLD